MDDAENGAVRLAIINGRPHDQGVGLGELLADPVADIVIEDAFPRVPGASSAGDAAPDGLVADPDNLALDAVDFQLLCNLVQSDGRVALLMRAAVDHQYLHGFSIFVVGQCFRACGRQQNTACRHGRFLDEISPVHISSFAGC